MIDYVGQPNKEVLLGELKIEGETIKVLKEIDPGVWLLYLAVEKVYALYSLLLGKRLIKCSFEGVPID